jgi:hypothetical protein
LTEIAQQIDRLIQVVKISEEQAIPSMRNTGMPKDLVQVMSSLNRIIAAGAVAELTEDAHRLLGRSTTTRPDFVAEHRRLWL